VDMDGVSVDMMQWRGSIGRLVRMWCS
jgi:hypothetical protein